MPVCMSSQSHCTSEKYTGVVCVCAEEGSKLAAGVALKDESQELHIRHSKHQCPRLFVAESRPTCGISAVLLFAFHSPMKPCRAEPVSFIFLSSKFVHFVWNSLDSHVAQWPDTIHESFSACQICWLLLPEKMQRPEIRLR